MKIEDKQKFANDYFDQKLGIKRGMSERIFIPTKSSFDKVNARKLSLPPI